MARHCASCNISPFNPIVCETIKSELIIFAQFFSLTVLWSVTKTMEMISFSLELLLYVPNLKHHSIPLFLNQLDVSR